MCRGNSGQRVFAGTDDYAGFLARLGTVAEAFHVEVHAYALMRNHVHLFVRTREPNLGRFMQRLLTGYTQWFNLRHTTYGHLFQGRYKALLVERSAYGAEVSRYIHLNPVRAMGKTGASMAERQARLRDYRWSSYRAMIGLARPEAWLVTTATLRQFGADAREQRQTYATFVEEGLLHDITDPTEEARAQSILGRDRFVDRIRRLVQQRQGGDRDSATVQRRLGSERLETVLERVARCYGLTPQELRQSRMGPVGSEARQVALWLARERCSGVLTARAIGRALGGVGGSAVCAAQRRIARRATHDKRLRRILTRLQ